jgi:hypothetical protein
MPGKSEATDRHHGGPGSSQQNAKKPEPEREKTPHPGEPTNPDRSRVSGGGGERDIAHSHDPAHKR